MLPLQKFSSYYFLHSPFVFIRFPFVFTRVHSCSIRVHSCSLVFTRVHSCSFVFHSCSTHVHSCSLVFIRVPLVFHSCSTRVHSCSTRVHSCSTRVHSCSLVFIRVHSCSFVFRSVWCFRYDLISHLIFCQASLGASFGVHIVKKYDQENVCLLSPMKSQKKHISRIHAQMTLFASSAGTSGVHDNCMQNF